MAENKYVINAYSFASKADYDRALKEKETVEYIKANTDGDNVKELLKIYNKTVSKASFQTVFGYAYLMEIRSKIIAAGIVPEEEMASVPVKIPAEDSGEPRLSTDKAARDVRRYKLLYESGRDKVKIYKMAVFFLVLILAAMVVITYYSKYSVFTFFTDYKMKIRTEVEDEYQYWQTELEKREAEIEAREKELGISEPEE